MLSSGAKVTSDYTPYDPPNIVTFFTRRKDLTFLSLPFFFYLQETRLHQIILTRLGEVTIIVTWVFWTWGADPRLTFLSAWHSKVGYTLFWSEYERLIKNILSTNQKARISEDILWDMHSHFQFCEPLYQSILTSKQICKIFFFTPISDSVRVLQNKCWVIYQCWPILNQKTPHRKWIISVIFWIH